MPDSRLAQAVEAFDMREAVITSKRDPKKVERALYAAMWFIENIRAGDPDGWGTYQELRKIAKEAGHG